MKSKRYIWIIIAILVATAGLIAYVQLTGDQHIHSMESTDVYTCPMHSSVRSDRPGACPVCGMALVRRSEGGTPEIDTEILGAISLSPTQRVVANISTVTARTGTLVREVRAVGLVTDAEPMRATVAARFRGRIETLYASVTGEKVARGEPLFELYSPDLISAQREFMLALEHAGIQSTLVSTASMQQQLLDAARERLFVHYGLTEEQVDRLEESGEVRNTVMFNAPISGTVLQKTIVEGDYVDEGMMLYRLADLSTVWVILDIYESDIGAIRLGQPVVVMVDSYPGEEFKGTVSFVDPVLDPATRTVRVRAEFKNRDGRLKPNMYAAARISRSINDVLLVPVQSIISTGTKDVVWVGVGENAFEPRAVKVGSRNANVAEILSGLREGEQVAATGGYLIDSESALQMPSGIPDPHAGHGMKPGPEEGATPKHDDEITIRVKGGYSPRVIHLRKGVPTKLNFLREESAQCTAEVVIREFGVRAFLPEGEEVVLEITPQESGEFVFSCGMNMIHGKIIVGE